MEKDVKDAVESTTDEATIEIVEESEVKTEETNQVKAGDKTEANLLLKSLQEEREKRRELEEALKEKELASQDVFSDEGKALQGQIEALKEELKTKEIADKFPAIKEKTSEFIEFRKLYPGVGAEQVAKLFLSENGLLETPTRKGLEKTTGGQRTPVKTGLSEEEVKSLRETNYRKYTQMLKDGKLDSLS